MPTTDEDELLIAAERGQMERLNKIVARSPTAVHYVNEKTGETPLIRAAEQDRPDAVRVLLEAGVNINAQCHTQRTALSWASSSGRAEVVAVLTESSADMELADEDGKTPLLHAAFKGRNDVVKVLIKHGAAVNSQDRNKNTALHCAASQEHLDVARALIAAGADCNAVSGQQTTPLHEAVSRRCLPIIDVLLEAGADPNARNKSGQTVLMMSVVIAGPEMRAIFERLLPVSDLDALDECESSALHWTHQQRDNTDFAEALIAAGANLNLQGANGMTPLHVAVLQNHMLLVDLLVRSRANLDAPSSNGWTPLIWATTTKKPEVAQALISAGANLDVVDQSGQTALIAAAEGNQSEIARALVAAGADLHAQRVDGVTALDIARAKQYSGIVAVLGDVEEKLIVAANDGDIATIRALLDDNLSCNIDHRGKLGRTALYCAVQGGHCEAAEVLVAAGADLDVMDDTGKAVPDVDPWLVAGAVGRRVMSQLEPVPEVTAFLGALQSVTPACAFAAKTIQLGAEATSAIQTNLKAQLVSDIQHNQRTRLEGGSPDDSVTLHDTRPIAELLHTFVDEPIERLRRSTKFTALEAPHWLQKTVVAAAFAAFCDIMGHKVSEITAEQISVYKAEAQSALADDRSIYEAVLLKMTNKHPKAFTLMSREAAATRRAVKAAFPARPPQPDLDADSATLLDLKVQAVSTADRFSTFVQRVVEACSKDGQRVAVSIDPRLKKSARMLQKWWLRKEVVSVCDVVRALITVSDTHAMLSTHTFLTRCDEIEHVDCKDRLNSPTSGGWADCVYLFRFRSADQSTQHICELQVALEPMVTARSAMDGHAAYAKARHKIEILEMLGVSIDEPTSSPPPEASGGGATGFIEPSSPICRRCETLEAENAALRKELAELKEVYGLVDAAAPNKKKSRSLFRFRSKSRD